MSESLYLLRPREAAKYVGSRNKLGELVRNGELPFVSVGQERRFRLGDLVDWQERNTRSAVTVAPFRCPTDLELKMALKRCKCK